MQTISEIASLEAEGQNPPGIRSSDVTIVAQNYPKTGRTFSRADCTERAIEQNFIAPTPRVRPRILVAEDHDLNQMLIMALADKAGLEAELASDGIEALAMVEAAQQAERPYRMVLMDVQMPRLDGLEATRRLRATGHAPSDLPVIALTANAAAHDVAICIGAGMQGHLAKPVGLSALTNLMNIYLDGAAECAAGAAMAPSQLTALYQSQKVALRDRFGALRAQATLGQHQRAELADRLHKLAGSAGLFNERVIGVAAAELERRVRVATPFEFIEIISQADGLLFQPA